MIFLKTQSLEIPLKVPCSCGNGYVNTQREQCNKCNGRGTVNLERNKYCDRNCNSCFGDSFLITGCNYCNLTGLKPCTRCNSIGKVD